MEIQEEIHPLCWLGGGEGARTKIVNKAFLNKLVVSYLGLRPRVPATGA